MGQNTGHKLNSNNPAYQQPLTIEPPHSNKDSGYSGSVNGLLDHGEQFNNVIPEYPPASTGLLDIARQSYSKYIHGAASEHFAQNGENNTDNRGDVRSNGIMHPKNGQRNIMPSGSTRMDFTGGRSGSSSAHRDSAPPVPHRNPRNAMPPAVPQRNTMHSGEYTAAGQMQRPQGELINETQCILIQPT